MTVTVKHAKTNAISDWTQAQLDEQIALGNFAESTVLADIVLPSDWNDDHTFTGTLDVSNGGTGATTLTGYVKGSGTSAFTASSTIPNTDISGLGTISTQNANSVAITGGSINGTTIGATTASTGRFTSVTTPSVTAPTDNLTLNTAGSGVIRNNLPNSVAWQFSSPASTVTRFMAGGQSVLEARICVPSWLRFQTGSSADFTGEGSEQFRVTNTASAVNYVQVTGAATGIANTPLISAQGSDSTVNLSFSPKGGGQVFFYQNGLGTPKMLSLSTVGGAVNYFDITPSTTNTAPKLSPTGTDTNISMAFQPKGTGAIDLAAGSSGVNISNGGTVTAITRTNGGSGYTSSPTIAISAPTTAGGVQATATCTLSLQTDPTITSGGTGYTVGDVLTLVGGTFAGGNAAQLTVSTVSAGVITGFTRTNNGNLYTVAPSSPTSVTGGTGTGATFNTTNCFSVQSVFTITNAGSGYIEQPTITFSGGGGSGASAYATVGSSVRLQSLGTTSELAFAFRGASGINSPTAPDILRLLDVGNANDTGIFIQNSPFGRAQVQAYGNANANLFLGANGSGRVSFTTNGTSLVEQMRVAHTASAVNYVQVTGSATGAAPTIQPAGSDANIAFNITPKGSGAINLNGFTRVGFNSTNFINISGSATTVAPSIASAGGDTNIDLSLTTKGTGAVNLNTGGGTQFQVTNTASANNYFATTGSNGGSPALYSVGASANIGANIVSKGTGSVAMFTNGGVTQLVASHTASAVNYVQVTGSTTGTRVSFTAQGSDANIGITYGAKGSQLHAFSNGEGTQFAINAVGATIANRLNVTASATGVSPSLNVSGTDTNIDLTLTPKGTGVVQFGTHTANADTAISGYITIRDAGGTLRKLAVIT